MASNIASSELIEVSLPVFAFALSLHAESLSTTGIQIASKHQPHLTPLTSAHLSQTSAGIELLLHSDQVPLRVCRSSRYRCSLLIPSSHPILQNLPPTPYETPLYAPVVLTLAQTHNLLSNILQPLLLPSTSVLAWPHPLTLSFEPEWPTSTNTAHPETHPTTMVISFTFEPTWSMEPRDPNDPTSIPNVPSTKSWHGPLPLNSQLFSTSTTPKKQPPLAETTVLKRLRKHFAGSFLMDLLLPYISPTWRIVRMEHLEPTTEHPNHLEISPGHANGFSNPSLRFNYGTDLFSLLYQPPYSEYDPEALFKTPHPYPFTALPAYTADELFLLDENPDISGPFTDYLQQALNVLQSEAKNQDYLAFLC